MDDSSMVISDRVRELRRRHGMTQEELAERSGLSLAVVKKIEQGGTARMETYHQLARALGVRTVVFVAPSSPEPTEQTPNDAALADMRSAINPPVGLTGKPLYGSADGDEPDLKRLRRAIESVAAAYHNDEYDFLAATVPALIRSSHHHVEALDSGREHEEALRLRADITGLSGRYLVQVRAHDLALIASHASLRDAVEIGDIPLAGRAVANQAWAMMRQGRFDEVEQLCAATADEIEPRMSTATPDELSSWGYLLLGAAGAAARNNRAYRAREYAALAVTAGARLGRQYENLAGHVPFGPMTTAFIGPEVELLDHRPDKALELASQVPHGVGDDTVAGLSRHRLNVARAHLRTDNADKATEILSDIRRQIPQWLRYQQYARDTVREILASRPRMPSEEQRNLADFMGIED